MKEKRKKLFSGLLPAIAAVAAGLLNGLLGTGGGIPLWFAAAKRGDRRTAFATSAGGVLLLSLFSVLLYAKEKDPTAGLHPVFLLFALSGGVCGALLLGKIPKTLLKWIFAALLTGSGVYILGKEFYRVFFA